MKFTFTVYATVERVDGKFATRDEMAEQLADALDSAQPSSLFGDNGGEYEVTDWNVNEEPQPKRKPRR